MNSNSSKFQLFLRKRFCSLKRNYYTLPFACVCVCTFFFLASLFIWIKSVGRIESFGGSAIFLFGATLTSILSIVALINYSKSVYGQKRPLKMLIIYYVLIGICIGLTIAVFVFNEKQIILEHAKQDRLAEKTAEWYTSQTYINYGVCSRTLFIIFFVLELITNGLLVGGPLIEKKLKSINFDTSFTNEKKE